MVGEAQRGPVVIARRDHVVGGGQAGDEVRLGKYRVAHAMADLEPDRPTLGTGDQRRVVDRRHVLEKPLDPSSALAGGPVSKPERCQSDRHGEPIVVTFGGRKVFEGAADVRQFAGDLAGGRVTGAALDLATAPAGRPSRPSWRERLTPRQCEVLELVAAGWSNAAIAERLVISEKAVVQHTSQIYDRLEIFSADEIHRRVRAVLVYLGRTDGGYVMQVGS